MQFQKVRIEDWEKLRAIEEGLESDLFAPCEDEEGYKRYITESQVFFITQDDETIGTISYKSQNEGPTIVNGLTLLPPHRGKGLAKKAMTQILEEIGHQDCALYVHPENSHAIGIYLKLGFVIKSWKENIFGNGQPRLYLERRVD